jgi:hypothetical protein
MIPRVGVANSVGRCEVCGRPFVSGTARTVAARCDECGRLTCPDCEVGIIADNGLTVGKYCLDCATTETEYGLMYRYH